MAQQRDFTAKRASNLTPTTTSAVLFSAADGSGNVQVFVPAGTKVFRVRASGTASATTTCNFTPAIYFGNATTTLLAGHAATAHNNASGGWFLEATLHLDVTNGLLHGSKRGWVGVTPTVLADTILSDVTCTTQALLNGKALAVGMTASTTAAGTVATVDSFSIDVLEMAK